MEIAISKIVMNDAPSIYDFICDLEGCNFNYKIFEQALETNIQNPNNFYLVAKYNEQQIIGFISCHTQWLLHHCEKVAEIQELYVLNEFRTHGIGQKLLKSIEVLLVQNDCKMIEVTAQIKRTRTHSFYEANEYLNTHKKFTKAL